MPLDIIEMIWRELRAEINAVRQAAHSTSLKSERAEYTDSIPAYTLANAPLAADGGLGDGTSYITLAWIRDGRKPGEGTGSGTGVLAFYNAGANQWVSLFDQSAVQT